ncbi:hypothetical protein CDD81_4593 [Ophiocordyceps australis]|uniref:Septin-type G domain-containing protein n=1 Tax=Ophiocordyceps australis TaxID=1399860 RepID=A0A2C5X6Z7_9HYPO|nr:hypothetical protein CDD81_4593 [Ophiocordyceps australis]
MRSLHAPISRTPGLVDATHSGGETTDGARPLRPPSAPLHCFLTTEADIDSQHAAPGMAMEPRFHKLPASPHTDHDGLSNMSRPATPLTAGTDSLSMPSSPGNSSCLSSSEGPVSVSAPLSESFHPQSTLLGPASIASNAALQLVMPSVAVPRRRPFTHVGRSLGKLRLLVTGQTGIGKTRLIMSIAQACPHIVYIDPVSLVGTNKVVDVYASSRSRPWWRANSDADVQMLRRKSCLVSDDILDKNICFADCPSPQRHSESAINYVESKLVPLCGKSMQDSDLHALVSGGSEPIVDVVLYLVSHDGPDPADLECIKSLQSLTNVIPLISRADEMSNQDLAHSKNVVAAALTELDLFSFTNADTGTMTPKIYAVSSATHADEEMMDASILMSSGYVQPLVPTDLEELVAQIFSVDGGSWLRHSAAAKAVEWRRRRLASSSALVSRRLASGGALVAHRPLSTYSESGHWERLDFSCWAEGLRQSLAAEKVGRLLSCSVLEVSPRPLTTRESLCRRTQRHSLVQPVDAHSQDPLGLLELAGQLKRGGRLALELASSAGVIGGIVACMTRPDLARYLHSKLLSY